MKPCGTARKTSPVTACDASKDSKEEYVALAKSHKKLFRDSPSGIESIGYPQLTYSGASKETVNIRGNVHAG